MLRFGSVGRSPVHVNVRVGPATVGTRSPPILAYRSTRLRPMAMGLQKGVPRRNGPAVILASLRAQFSPSTAASEPSSKVAMVFDLRLRAVTKQSLMISPLSGTWVAVLRAAATEKSFKALLS